MREEEKPFVCYRRGRWQIKIEPRGAAGWRAMGLWIAALLLGQLLLIALTARLDDGDYEWVIGLCSLLLTLGWVIAMLRWMLARSEVVDLDQQSRPKRKGTQGGRRRS